MIDLSRKKFLKFLLLGTGLLAVGKIFKIDWISTANAWTDPAVAPPAGNVSAPINTGSLAQTKAGNLTVQGTFLATGKMKIPVGTDLYV
jgi:hypothetical protein